MHLSFTAHIAFTALIAFTAHMAPGPVLIFMYDEYTGSISTSISPSAGIAELLQCELFRRLACTDQLEAV